MGPPPEPPRISATPGQVAGFRARQQHLDARLPAAAVGTVLADMGGAQAQVLSAAYLSIGTRLDGASAEALARSFRKERSLARAWAMRQTLYLVPSDRLAVFLRGSARRADRELTWARNRGVSDAQLDRLIEATLTALATPATRAEIVERVGALRNLPVVSRRGGGWGGRGPVPCVKVSGMNFPATYLVHLAASRGVICAGPDRDGAATLVRADAGLAGFRDLPVEEAEDALLRIYVRAFGPTCVADYAWWTGLRLRDARRIWERSARGFAPVEVDGAALWVREEDLGELLRTDTYEGVRLLPYFDGFVLGHRERPHLLHPRHVPHVYRPQGWVAPVVLLDGRAAGVWEHRANGRTLRVDVRLFHRPPRPVARELRTEAEAIAAFLGRELDGLRVGRAAAP